MLINELEMSLTPITISFFSIEKSYIEFWIDLLFAHQISIQNNAKK